MADLCGAKARHGGRCGKPAGWGTDHNGYGRCKHHGGASPNGRTHAAGQAARAEVAKLGMAIETDPHEALAACVNIHAGTVGFLQGKIAELDEGEVVTKGDLHPMVRALNGALDQLRQAAKAAVDAGVDERRLRLDERAQAGMAAFLRAVLGDLELTSAQEARVASAMDSHRALLDDLGARPRELTA